MSISFATFWLVLALALAGMEMISGTFYLLAVACGVASGAIAAWMGFSVAIQIAVIAIVGVIAVAMLHQWRKTNLPPPEDSGSMEIGQRVKILSWKSDRQARVQYRGSQWDGELAADANAGLTEYFIIAVRGSTLTLHHQLPEQN